MKRASKETVAGLAFASPWIIGFCVFLAYPLLQALYLSLTDYNTLNPPVWVGFDNYIDLFKDELFHKSLVNTFTFAAFSLPLSMVFGISLALLLNNQVKGLSLYRAIFYVPSLVPMISLAMLWLWLFNGDYGIINIALKSIGISNPPLWLSDANWSKPALVVMSLWGVGNAMVIYLAGLQNVPVSLYESAELDGAGPFRKVWSVTLPLLSPVIQFNLIMGIIGSLQVFALPYVMFPGGAPDRATYFFAMYLWDSAFINQRMGYASAMGWVMFLMIFALTMVSIKLSDKGVHYS